MKFLIFPLILLFSCAHSVDEKSNPQTPFLVATKYFQNSGESAALYHQGYNVAYQYIEQLMKSYKHRKPACVVLDVDETILDNSFYQGTLFEKGEIYDDKTWDEWVMMAKAPALPGVVEYLKKVRDLGVEPIFITNRRSHLVEATVENMEKVGIPVDPKFIVGRDKIHSKELRRTRFGKDCNIVQLIGDNLSDFSDDYNSTNLEERKDQVRQNKSNFGTRYILLPNPMYGDWRKTILDQPLKKINQL